MVYKLGKLIGKGSDGIVYELIVDDKCDDVIKFIQGDIYGIKNYMEYFILFNLDERYVTRCKKIEIDDDGLIKLIFRRANCDLKDFLQDNRITKKRKKILMLKLLEGLEYLHSYNIIHGDIKPSNILVFDNMDSPSINSSPLLPSMISIDVIGHLFPSTQTSSLSYLQSF